MEWYWIVLISILGAYLLINIIGSLILAHIAIIRNGLFHKQKADEIPDFFKVEDPETFKNVADDFFKNGEYITHKMRDGATMYARIYIKEGADKTVIFSHGFRGSAIVDYYNTYDRIRNENVNLVFISCRSHGKSEGKFITMGYIEKDDLHEWVDDIYSRLHTSIYLWGTSMGCATTLFSLDKPYGEYVKGIVADCGYYNLYYQYYTTFKKYCGSFLSRVVTEFLGIWILLIAHINFRKLKTTDVINNTNVPILFVHGEKDDFVLPINTMKNFNMYKGPKDLLIVKNGPHARNMYYGKTEYIEKVKKLLEIN